MEQNKIPTIDELFKKYSSLCQFEEGDCEYLINKEDFKSAVLEITKYHVETALLKANENADLLADGERTYINKYVVSEGNHYSETEININENSILLAYPLENIK